MKVISIKRSIFYSLTIIITVSIVLSSIAWLINERNDLKHRINELKEREINEQKNLLKQEVEKTILDINFQINYRKSIKIDSIQNEVLEWVSKKRLVYGGYLFVNKLDGQALVFDGKKLAEFKNIAEMTDPNGLRIFDIEKEAYYSDDGKFMEYLFKPMDSEIPEEKISYMKGFPKWEWIIGAGIYKKIPTAQIEAEKKVYYQSFNNKILFVSFITLLLLTIGYFIVKFIETVLNRQVALLQESLAKVNTAGGPIDLSRFRFSEFRQIGSSVNQMIDEKKELEETLAEADENLKLIFHVATNVAFIVAKPGGKFPALTGFSPGAEKIFGYNKDEIINQGVDMLVLTESLPDVENIIRQMANNAAGASGEIICVRKGNQPFTAFYNVHPFKAKDSVCFMAVIIDISESKRTEEELARLKISLEQKVEERTKEIIAKSEQLEEKNKELEYYNKLFIGREFRINELKQKIKELESKFSQFKNGGLT